MRLGTRPAGEMEKVLRLLRRQVAAAGLTQAEAAARGGFTAGHLSLLLSGKEDLKVKHLLAVLDAVGGSPAPFFAELASAFGRALPAKLSTSAAGILEERLTQEVRRALPVELLFARTQSCWGFDVGQAIVWAERATARAEEELRGEPENRPAADTAALAWAYAANSQRIQGDLAAADRSLATAHLRLRQGTGDLKVRARVLSIEATQWRGQRRFSEAIAQLREVIDLYTRAGRPDLVARARLTQALNLQNSGELEAAAAEIAKARSALGPEAGRWYVMALAIQAQLAAQLGRQREASRLIPRVRELLQRHGGPLDRLRWRYFEAEMQAAREGEERQALRELRAVYEAFLEHGLVYDAALVCLDRAVVYARLGRTAEIKQLVLEMTPVFVARDIHREAMAALRLFRYAAEAEEANLTQLTALRRYLEEARDRPGLAFRQRGQAG